MSLFDDRNKTDMTKAVTAATCFWLDERGCKPVETEVPIAMGWVADIAGVCSPTETELQDLKLIRRKPAWKKPAEDRDAWHKEANALDRVMTAIVEVKTSRGDFLGDKKWKVAPIADLCWIASPAGLIGASEIPPAWGLLEYSEKRNCMISRRSPSPSPITAEQQLNIVLSVAVRRDNQTRYEHLRRLQREERDRRNEGVSLARVKVAMRAALTIARGEQESVEGALAYHGIKLASLGELEMLRLAELWNCAPRVAQ